MSKLKNNELTHTSNSGTSNIVMASNGDVTLARNLSVGGASTFTGAVTLPAGTTPLSFRNLVINGAMQVAQRGDVTGVQDGYGGCDRFKFVGNSAARATLNKTTGPTSEGFSSCQEVDVTTADASLAAGDYHYLGYRFEGQDVQQLKKGTANAESVTLSFWVSSPKTGTHIIQLYDNDNTRHICKSYSVSSANTWEKKTLTFAGDTTGALGNDNQYSLQIYWWLLAGTNFTSGSLATSWASYTAANAAVGQVNCLDNTSNDFKLTGVQLEVGSTATDFEHKTYNDELVRCQRYYYRINTEANADFLTSPAWTPFANQGQSCQQFPVPMRAKVTALEQSGTATDYQVSYGSGGADCNVVPTFNNGGLNGCCQTFAVAGGPWSVGDAVRPSGKNTNAFLAWSAEL